jgi:photosystem II stability/assembly factor-like uncharacterized protein
MQVLLKAVDYSGSGAWHDESGYGRDATLENGTATKNAAGNGIVLNGSTGWTFPNVGVGNAWTASVWYKNLGSFPASSCILTQRIYNSLVGLSISNLNNDASYMGVGYIGSTGPGNMLAAGYYGGTPIQSYLASKQWVNIQGTWDGRTIKTYINGALVGSVNCSGGTSVDNGLAYRIGRRWDGTDYMTGEIGEVRIYNYPLTAAEVLNDYNASYSTFRNLMVLLRGVDYGVSSFNPTSIPGLQLWMDGDDQTTMTFSGSTVTQWRDKSGLANNTTGITGTPTFTDGSGIVFDGSSYFTLPNSAIPYGDSSYSIYVVANYSNNGIIIGAGARNTNQAIQIFPSPTNKINTLWFNNDIETSSTTSSGTRFLYDSLYQSGANRTLFLNGAAEGSDTPGTRSQPNTGNYIGSDVSTAYTFNGVISEILIYNTSHTTGQRAAVEAYLSAKWNLGLTIQPVWLDESGKGLNATLENGTATKNVAGNGLVLDGSTNWTFPNVGVGNAWTASVWFKNTGSTTGPNLAGILGQLYGGPGNHSNLLIGYLYDNGPFNTAISGGFVTATISYNGTLLTLTNNIWTNIQITWDGSFMTTYINGSLLGVTTPGGVSTDSTLEYKIGRFYPSYFSGNTFITGEIGEVRIYNYPLTAAQVTADYNASYATFHKLMVLLRGVNYTSGTWADESGLGFNATLENGTATKNGANNGLVLNGSTSWTFPNVAVGPRWTASVWYKNTGAASGIEACILTQKYESTPINLSIGYLNGPFTGRFYNDTTWYQGNQITLINGVWINIQVTWDGSFISTYINGSLLGTTQPGGVSIDGGLAYRIGRRYDVPDYMVGEIGEVRIYNYALNQTQVTTDYYASHDTFLSPTIPTAPLIHVRPKVTNRTIQMNWQPPIYHGTIANYTIASAQDASAPYTVSSTARQYVVTDLSDSVAYTYTIKATNGQGAGAIATFRTVRPGLRAAVVPTAVAVKTGRTTATVSWTPLSAGTLTQQTGSGSKYWVPIRSSADGTLIVSITNINDYIYLSRDSGVTWNPVTSAGSKSWQGLGMSSNGSRIVAGGYNENLYASVDYGVTWTDISGVGGTGSSYVDTASSADGSVFYTSRYGANIVRSTYAGNKWSHTLIFPPQNVDLRAVACDATGTIVYSASYASYLVKSTDSGATWTNPALNAMPVGVRCSSDGVHVAALDPLNPGGRIYVSNDSGATWTLTLQSNNPLGGLSVSPDGSFMAATMTADRIYISNDYGATWTAQAGTNGLEWYGIALTADGRKYAAATYGGYIYTGTPSYLTTPPLLGYSVRAKQLGSQPPYTNHGAPVGATSIDISGAIDLSNNAYVFRVAPVNDPGYSVALETNPVGKINYTFANPSATYPYVGSAFQSVAASTNGQKVVACAKSGGSIWTSTDRGETWTQQTAAGTRGWISVACDASGASIIAADLSGSLWTSADSGATWTERTTAGSRSWGVVTMSPNGLYVAAGVTNGYIYTSADRGVSWTERTGSTVQDWASLTISTDGTTLYAGENDNAQYADASIYKSTDSGATWATVDLIKGQGGAVACSSDGSIIYMGSYSYDMFKSTDTGVTWTALSFSGATGVVACSSDGTKVVGVANGYINTSSNSGSSWTQRTEPGSNDTWKVTCDASGATIYAVSNGSSGSMYVWKSTDFGATWASTLISDTLDSVQIAGFDSLKCSKNGRYVYLSIAYGYLWSSSDYGATWTRRYSSAIYDGTPLACSDNGSIVYAGGIHSISTDYGVTWNSVSVAGGWCAISSDGTIIAVYGGGMIYISRDTGATWTGYPQTSYYDVQPRGMGMSANGQVVIGTYQKGAYVTADGGTTWYTTPDPGEWSCIRISADKTKVIATNAGFMYLSLDSGVKWLPLLNAGSFSWTSISVSSDFTKMAATVKNGGIYFSTDSGTTWTLGQFSAGHDWYSVTGDSTGQYLTAVENGGYIWHSRDFGASWYHYESLAPYSFSTSSAFKSIATSSDGTGIIAAAANQSLWRWNNTIKLWLQVAATPSGNWSSVSICYYNSALILAADISGYLWRSSDAGLTWTQLTAAGSRDWSVVMISNTSIAAAAVRNGYVYTSADGGLTWTERTGSGTRYWASLTISSDDGTTLYAGENNNAEYQNAAIWKSTDSGVTWATVDNGLNPNANPSAFSSDGTKMYTSKASNVGPGIYFSSDLGKSWTFRENSTVLGNLSSLACSPNGSFLVAANGSSVYTSSNSGVDWTSVFTPTGYSNISAACDTSGQKIYTIGQDASGIYIWTSNNSGSTWSSAALVSSSLATRVRNSNFICSKDGKFLYFAIYYGYVWGSYDYGATWTEFATDPPGVTESRYLSCTDSGSTVYVTGAGGSVKGVFDVGTSAWTWSSITLNGGIANFLTVSGNGSVLGAITDKFYKSTDSGSTWTGYPVTAETGGANPNLSYDGSIILIVPTRAPLVSVDGGTTWYTDPDPGEWSCIRMSANKTKVVAANIFGTYYSYIQLSTDSGDTWVPLTAAGSRKWSSISVSSDFTKMAATVKNGGIYYSTDSGATWTLGTNSGSHSWSSISGNSTNQYLNAVENGGTIWTSSDYGATWSAVANPGAATWLCAAISADATTMLAGELVPWVSNNGGVDWRKVPLFSPGSVNTFSSFISPDGTFIAVAINDITTPRNIWTSSDSGYSWTERTTSGARVWTGIAGSSDGSKLVAVADSSYIYTSSNSGATWTQRATSAGWRGAASDSTGQYLATTQYGGYIYTSDDSGENWTQRATAQDWIAIASNYNGQHLVAAVKNGGSIWTSADYGVTWVERTAAGTRAWYSVACSAYGNNIIAGVTGTASLWASSDFGATWSEQTGSASGNWYGVASSANARTILAVKDSVNEIVIGTI